MWKIGKAEESYSISFSRLKKGKWNYKMLQKGRIFLLDDDELIVSMLSMTLKKEGYEVFLETKIHDVVNKIRSWSPDVVLLDINLPERSGMDIT